MARGPVALLHLAQIRLLCLAALQDARSQISTSNLDRLFRRRILRQCARAVTARMKFAAAWESRRVRHTAGDGCQAVDISPELRHRPKQPLRVRMLRRVEQLLNPRALDD